MAYWYINTEAKDFDGVSQHALWLQHGRAFTSGGEAYAKKLQKLHPGDICFMYANRLGVVAMGEVQAPCHGQAAIRPLVYRRPDQGSEYQAEVRWTHQFPGQPIPPAILRKLTGSFARQTIQRIPAPAAARLIQECHQAVGSTAVSETRPRHDRDA